MPLSSNILALLNIQYQHEKYNEHRYLVRSSLADFYGLTGIAKFLRNQADGERDHAMKVFEYIADRNEKIGNTQVEFDSPPEDNMLDILKGILKIEQDTTAKLNNLYMQANAEGDFMTASWLLTGLIPEQIEEESISQTIIDRYNSRLNINTLTGNENITMASEVGAALHDIDSWIDEKYNG